MLAGGLSLLKRLIIKPKTFFMPFHNRGNSQIIIAIMSVSLKAKDNKEMLRPTAL
jgi:hypothetical protein